MAFVYILAFGVITALAIIIGWGDIMMYISTPSIVLTVAGILLFVLASGRWADFSRGVKHLFEWRRSLPLDRETAVRISRFFRKLSSATLGIGFFWSLVGLMIMLCHFDPETIGPGLAMCLLTLFYAFFLSVAVFLPISLYYDSKE